MYHCSRRVIALTHGFEKKGDKIPEGQMERTRRIKEEYDSIRRGMKDEGDDSA